MAPIGCGFTPMLFGDKSVKLVQRLKNYPKSMVSQIPMKTIRFSKATTSQPTSNFILMMELRKRIITFRDIIDLPPCSTSLSTNQLLVGTLKDLQKIYPGSLPHFHRSELKRLPLDKMLVYFCKSLHQLGDNTSKMSDEWIEKYKYDLYENDKCTNVDKLVEIATAELNELIKVARQNLDISEHEDGGNKELDSKDKKLKDLKKICSKKNSSGCPSPISVVPEAVTTDSPNSSSVTVSFRVQPVGIMSYMDVRRLKLHMFPSFGLNLPSCLNPKKVATDQEEQEKQKEEEQEKEKEKEQEKQQEKEQEKEKEEKKDNEASLEIKASIVEENEDPIAKNKTLEEPVSIDDHKTAADDECNTKLQSTEAHVSMPTSPAPSVEVLSTPPPPPPLPPTDFLHPKVREVSRGAPLPPPLPPKLKPNVLEKEQELPSTKTLIPPPPPAPLKSTIVAKRATPPPPPPPAPVMKAAQPPLPPSVPLQPKASASGILAPTPTFTKKDGPLPPPPPPMPAENGATTPPPPPPPGGGGAKSARTRRPGSKLRRSSHMGNLYRNLKGIVEGSPVQGKSFGRKKGGVKSNTNGQQGMADALAEMTRRSSYFQKLEEDVEKYAQSIYELKVAIGKFKTKDMPELLNFHKYVESILESLTDETQVLARYEDFPVKKLEALRTSSSLYSKLESMIKELESMKTVPPLLQLLDKVTRSFNKIKGEIDTLERTKETEAKTFKAYGIEFDFQIITRIKEAMVDVSSNCMDLVLKERREVKMAENEGFKTEAQNKASIKMLWRVFQFAFQVYTFAGGHDERAQKLTEELAHEIESDAEYQIEAIPTGRRRKNKPRRMGSRNKNSCPTSTVVPT